MTARMAEGSFDYSWEYQGAGPRLVVTPLTDKAYLTLTQVCLGGGRAGTRTLERVFTSGRMLALCPSLPIYAATAVRRSRGVDATAHFAHAHATPCANPRRRWRWAMAATPTAPLAPARQSQ